MANKSKKAADKYQDVLGSIDGILTALSNMSSNAGYNSNDTPSSPFVLLIEILRKLGVTEEDLINWLAYTIKYALPALELSIKGVLLSNMKKMISCSVDPRIPKKAREEGLYFDLNSIDPQGLLTASPLNEKTNQLYFGYDKEEKNPHQLIRCNDFNAFLWYVVHFGKKPNPIKIDLDKYKNAEDYFIRVHKANTFKGESLYSYITFQNTGDDVGINEGVCYQEYKNNEACSCISICSQRTDVLDDSSGEEYITRYYTIQPLSDYWNRITYYFNRSMFATSNLTEEVENTRDYNKDLALMSLKYIGYENVNDSEDKNQTVKDIKNKLNVRILPKGFLHIPHVGQKLNKPLYIVFNEKGECDKNGRFTIKFGEKNGDNIEERCHTPFNLEISQKIADALIDGKLSIKDAINDDPVWYYRVLDKPEYKLAISKEGKWCITEATISNDTKYSSLKSVDTEKLRPYLKECYAHYTIYEFNFDYVMSLRLFDSKVIMANLLNTLYNFQLGLNIDFKYNMFGKSVRQIEMSEAIVEMVKKVIESEDEDDSDCFFSFSNDEYERMSQKAEMKRANLSPFGDGATDVSQSIEGVTELLNEFGDAATLEKSKKSLTRVFELTQAIIHKEEDYNESTITEVKQGWNVNCDIIMTALNSLLVQLASAILTPKILLLVMVNAELCGQGALYNLGNMTLKEILNQLTGIINNIIKEIKDILLQQLYEMVLSKLRETLALFATQLIFEQAQDFARTMRLLLTACSFRGGGSRDLIYGNDYIDNVDYADIDEPKLSNNKC